LNPISKCTSQMLDRFGMRKGSRWWTATVMTVDPPLTLITILSLKNLTTRELFDENQMFSDWHDSVADLVVLAFARVSLFFFFYIVVGTLRSWPTFVIYVLTLIYLITKSIAVYAFGSVDSNRVIVFVENLVFATLETFMINLLVRKWKSDDWQQSHIDMYHKQNESALLQEQGMVSQPAVSEQDFSGGITSCCEGAAGELAKAPNGCSWTRPEETAREEEKTIYKASMLNADTMYCHHFNEAGEHLVLHGLPSSDARHCCGVIYMKLGWSGKSLCCDEQRRAQAGKDAGHDKCNADKCAFIAEGRQCPYMPLGPK